MRCICGGLQAYNPCLWWPVTQRVLSPIRYTLVLLLGHTASSTQTTADTSTSTPSQPPSNLAFLPGSGSGSGSNSSKKGGGRGGGRSRFPDRSVGGAKYGTVRQQPASTVFIGGVYWMVPVGGWIVMTCGRFLDERGRGT